jgi:hypothetical protein
VQLTAVFESWHIGDGNYPPLHRGQLVRLSFELEPRHLRCLQGTYPPALHHLGDAEYKGRGLVLRRYDSGNDAIAVLEAGGFRFYVSESPATAPTAGSWVEFDGTLLLDHYSWVEFLDEYADPPDLFYTLQVTRVRKVSIPDRFIHRHSRGKSYPARVSSSNFGTVEELETMEGQSFGEEFYIIDFDGRGLETVDIPQTFR